MYEYYYIFQPGLQLVWLSVIQAYSKQECQTLDKKKVGHNLCFPETGKPANTGGPSKQCLYVVANVSHKEVVCGLEEYLSASRL